MGCITGDLDGQETPGQVTMSVMAIWPTKRADEGCHFMQGRGSALSRLLVPCGFLLLAGVMECNGKEEIANVTRGLRKS
jgi:hypothetical protein